MFAENAPVSSAPLPDKAVVAEPCAIAAVMIEPMVVYDVGRYGRTVYLTSMHSNRPSAAGYARASGSTAHD